MNENLHGHRKLPFGTKSSGLIIICGLKIEGLLYISPSFQDSAIVEFRPERGIAQNLPDLAWKITEKPTFLWPCKFSECRISIF